MKQGFADAFSFHMYDSTSMMQIIAIFMKMLFFLLLVRCLHRNEFIGFVLVSSYCSEYFSPMLGSLKRRIDA